MPVYDLSGKWEMHQSEPDKWVSAEVPGGVHLDLMRAGLIPDPFVGDHESRVQWVAEKDWVYRRTFEVDESMLTLENLELVCDGLDTLAEVFINGIVVARADNMFCQYRWKVKNHLNVGTNEISVVFSSPVKYAAQKMIARPLACTGNWISGWQYLRKAACHFGWDLAPKLATAGIWKDIRLEGWTTARIKDVFIRQNHYGNKVTLGFQVQLENSRPKNLEACVRMTDPHGKVIETRQQMPMGRSEVLPIYVDHPELWWPNGYGAQPLYDAEISLLDGQTVLDVRHYQIGLRTLQVQQNEDPWGTSFTIVVNNLPIFCKGSNWIPPDSFPTRTSPAQTESLIRSAAAVHQNMLRVWGGGYYEDEAFYNLCDRYGILVWQDFMFACAAYPFDEDIFLGNVREEVSQIVRRLRHHACLALWCGNVALELGWAKWGWNRTGVEGLKKAHDRFFFQILPAWVMDDDPERLYWPGSPSSGEPFEDPQSDQKGDIHQWKVWHDQKPIQQYRDTTPRFVSEFGFQSLPALKTIATFAHQVDWNLTSYVMEQHQKDEHGYGKMMGYLVDHFRIPRDFKSLIYLTQVQQAEALRLGVEHWRRYCERTGGALYWQLNDCWPGASWSTIDYYGRWKAAHYFARHFFAPLLVSVEDKGSRLELFVTNDSSQIWTGLLRWSLMTLDGEVLDGDEHIFMAMPTATAMLEVFDFSGRLNDGNQRNVVLVIECMQDDRLISMQVIKFVPNKYLMLKKTAIDLDFAQNGSEVEVTLFTASMARYVEITLEGVDVIFSDNYFDLPARKPYRVYFPLPQDWSLEQVRKALSVHSLVDTF
jgi:beta-mannosidase